MDSGDSSPAIIYRASGLGGCTKAQIANRLGFDPLPPTKAAEGYFREGNLHERAVVAWLEEQGYVIHDQQREVSIRIIGDIEVVGHIDGIIDFDEWHITSRPRLLEIKTMGDSSWNDLYRHGWDTPGLVQKYKWQTSAYSLGLGGLQIMLVVKNRNNGKHLVLHQEKPFYSLADIRHRVLQMEVLVRKGELPERCDASNFPCPFLYLHEEDEPELVTDEVVGELAEMYKSAQRQKKIAEERYDKAKVALKKSLGDRKKVVLPNETKITVFEANNPPALDKAKMVEDGIDVEKYMTRSKSERMRVMVKETDGSEGDHRE